MTQKTREKTLTFFNFPKIFIASAHWYVGMAPRAGAAPAASSSAAAPFPFFPFPFALPPFFVGPPVLGETEAMWSSSGKAVVTAAQNNRVRRLHKSTVDPAPFSFARIDAASAMVVASFAGPPPPGPPPPQTLLRVPSWYASLLFSSRSFFSTAARGASTAEHQRPHAMVGQREGAGQIFCRDLARLQYIRSRSELHVKSVKWCKAI